MATATIDIWNLALNKIGVTKVVTSESQDVVEARTCLRIWPDIRDEVLADYPMPFSKAQAVLVEDTVTTRFGWEHVYTLPSGFLAARFLMCGELRIALVEADARAPFEIMLNDAATGQILCCDLAEDDIDALVYTHQITDVSAFPPAFVDAVAWRLAVELALSIKKDANGAERAMQAYQMKIRDSFAQQLRGNREDPPLEGSGIRARN
jgi:hypothetical protein